MKINKFQAGRRSWRLVEHLSTMQKFAVVGVVLLVPLAHVMHAFLALQEAQIAFSAKERVGVRYIIPATKLLGDVVTARSAAVKAAAEGADVLCPDLATDIHGMDVVDARSGSALETTGKWLALKKELGTVTSTSYATASAAFDAYSAVAADVIGLITQAGNESNLSMDPDLDSFYLMDAFVVQVPALVNGAGQLADLAAMSVADGRRTGDLGDVRLRVAMASGAADARSTSLQSDLTTSFGKTADRTMEPALTAPLRAQQDATRAALDGSVAGGAPTTASVALGSAIAPRLDHLLSVRVDGFTHDERKVKVVAAAAVLVAIGLFVVISRAITRSTGGISAPLQSSSRAREVSLTADEVMTVTVREVAANAAGVSQIAVGASEVALATSGTISKLDGSSEEIVRRAAQIQLDTAESVEALSRISAVIDETLPGS